MAKTINFCGDSFCEYRNNTSWCTQLADQLNCDQIGEGKAGAAHEHAIQSFNPQADITVFCWTEPTRVHHSEYPLSFGSCSDLRNTHAVYEAGYQFYKWIHENQYFIDRQKRDFYWFENEVLSNYSGLCIHLWSFRKTYQWKHGYDLLRSPLMSYSNRFPGRINHFNPKFNQILSKKLYNFIRSLHG